MEHGTEVPVSRVGGGGVKEFAKVFIETVSAAGSEGQSDIRMNASLRLQQQQQQQRVESLMKVLLKVQLKEQPPPSLPCSRLAKQNLLT